MRKRLNRVTVCFDEKEYNSIKSLCIKTGLSMSDLFRYLIAGCVPIEAPSVDYPMLIRELRMVGNNLNQLVKHAHTVGYLNANEIEKALEDLCATERKVNLAFTVK